MERDPALEGLIAEIEAETRHTAQFTGRSVLSPRVLAALRRVRRAAFVPEEERARAYVNRPLPIGHHQTISQPFIVAIMTELLDVAPGDVVLEVGTGSGYQAAVLAELAGQVCSVEIIAALTEAARGALAGYRNIALRTGDGALGWPERAPFDAIMVTAAAAEVPPALLAQLKPGGRMVIPVGAPWAEQRLMRITKHGSGAVMQREVLRVAFVPLVGGG